MKETTKWLKIIKKSTRPLELNDKCMFLAFFFLIITINMNVFWLKLRIHIVPHATILFIFVFVNTEHPIHGLRLEAEHTALLYHILITKTTHSGLMDC